MARVYIGVGHGGSDAGAVQFLIEKDVNLKMALACMEYLQGAGVETMISRTDDSTVSINTKTKQANEFKADVALDIHNNAGGGVGFEVFHSINGGIGKTLAANIEKEVIRMGQSSRGLKTRKGSRGDYFGFIRQTAMPAVILEGVFVDNQEDAAKADTDEKCRAFGVAYAKGILQTLDVPDNEKGTGSTIVADGGNNGIPYMVKVISEALNIRSGAGMAYKVTGVIRDKGIYTITAEQLVSGRSWGRLKSGAGWICLDYTKRV